MLLQVDQKTLNTDGATKLTLLGKGPTRSAAGTGRVKTVRVHVASHAAPEVQRDCVGVLTGVKGSVECF